MSIRLLAGKLTGVFTRPALVSMFLLINAFVWYSYATVVLQKSIAALDLDFLPNMIVWSTHFVAMVLSALLGVHLIKKLGGRTRFLVIWVLVGTVASLAPLAFGATNIFNAIALCLIFGFTLGFGMPNCMGYFTSQVPIENRGRIGGLVILCTGLGTAGLDLLGINGFAELTITLVIWRATALVVAAFANPGKKLEDRSGMPSYRAVVSQRPFILYFIPWVMFALLYFLTGPVEQNAVAPSVFSDLQLLQSVFSAPSALLGGVFMDLVGRKRLAITGFVMLGLSYSILSFFNNTSVSNNMPIWYAHAAMNGVSFGILYVLFVVTIWGDLDSSAPSDKFYALGVLPFFISKMLQVTVNSQIVATIPISAVFSFAAVYLFLAVLPLVYTPETLPEKIIKDRELKNYIEKAKKASAKAPGIHHEDEQSENGESKVEFEVIPEDEKKAQELAEKYY
jgi:MFS family permease